MISITLIWLFSLFVKRTFANDPHGRFVEMKTTYQLVEEEVAERDWIEFNEKNEDIIDQTNRMSVWSFPANLRPYSSTIFKSVSHDKLSWAQWADNKADLDRFRQHLNNFEDLTKDNGYLNDDSKIASLLGSTSAISKLLSSGLSTQKIYWL